MAEGDKIVLAQLTIDSRGMVTGVASGVGALGQGERALDRFADRATRTTGPMDLITKRMFNLRTAVVALLGGFTVAGVIFQLGNLGRELITSTSFWKTWSEAVRDSWKALQEGETPMERASRKVGEILKLAGIQSPALAALETLLKIPKLHAELLAKSATEDASVIEEGFRALEKAQIQAINTLQKIQMERNALKLGLGGLRELVPQGPVPFINVNRPLPGIDFSEERAFQLKLAEQGAMQITSAMVQAAEASERLTAEIGWLGIQGPPLLMNLVPPLNEFNKQIQATVSGMELFAQVGAQAAGLAAQAILQSGAGFRQALSNILKGFAVQSVVEGVMELARASAALAKVAAGNPAGVAEAAAHKASAKLFFKAAAISGAAGLALGGRGEEGGGAGAFRSVGAFGEPSNGRPTTSVTVVIEGAVIGVGQSKEQFAREMAELIEDVVGDNVRIEGVTV